MSTGRPATLAEWATYIASLDGERLASKARAANSIVFTEALGEDGFSPDEIETVLILFARHAARRDVRVGERGLFDFDALARRTPPIAIELPPPGPPIVEEVDGEDDADDAGTSGAGPAGEGP